MEIRALVSSKRTREFAGVLLFGLAVILLMSLMSYDANDPSYFTHNESLTRSHNYAGRMGATLATALLQSLGLAAYLLPLLAGGVGVLWFARRDRKPAPWRAAGHMLSFGGLVVLLHLLVGTASIGGGELPAGGFLGTWVGGLLVRHLNRGGAGVLALLAVLLGVLAATRLSLQGVGFSLGSRAVRGVQQLRLTLHRYQESRRKERMRRAVVRKHARRRDREVARAAPSEPARGAPAPKVTLSPKPSPAAAAPPAVSKSGRPRAAAPPVPPPATAGGFHLPSLDLLPPSEGSGPVDRADLEDKARLLVERCAEFGVNGEVVEIHPGPVVTTFEFRPEPGVKYSKVTGLVDDLCLALSAESIRIERLAGKSTVGIEVPNREREIIFLRDILGSQEFQGHGSLLRIGLGKGIEGKVQVADLADMPHLLIAGATGSGKSVTLNAVITSILYTATPDEVKFIMVDTKRLELGLYESIPHLIAPVVTEPKKASNALRWAVVEMEVRYKKLAQTGVRNIGKYNRSIRKAADAGKPLLAPDETPLETIPYLIVVIDELADLMLTAPREVEESITRLAQMARAVGIHLILSTQRPSVDVITGVIKANLPSRLALRVTSKIDSRTILDANGAEKLLGMGDMLFIPPRSSRMIRIHGPYLTEVECSRLVEHLRDQAKPRFDKGVTADPREGSGSGGIAGPQDAMYGDAVRLVVETGQASTSQLQRRLRLGFARAGRLMDMLEAEGVVGPQDGSRPRQVLVGPEYLEELQTRGMEAKA